MTIYEFLPLNMVIFHSYVELPEVSTNHEKSRNATLHPLTWPWHSDSGLQEFLQKALWSTEPEEHLGEFMILADFLAETLETHVSHIEKKEYDSSDSYIYIYIYAYHRYHL